MENTIPKHALIREYITEQIDSQKLPKGGRLPTEKQLCSQFNVSRVTVQTALNDLQKMGKIYRVRGGGSYVGSPQADAGKISKPDFIPFIISDKNPSTRCLEIINGVEDFLKTKSCYVTIHSPNGDNSAERDIINSLIENKIRSMIILPFRSDSNIHFYFDLIQKNINLVFIDILPNGLVSNLVSSNNVLGGYLATHHLIQKGYKKIALVSGAVSSASSIADRINGYRFAHFEAKIEPKKEYECLITNSLIDGREMFLQELYNSLERIFSLPNPPDSLFCINDRTAADTYAALQKLGLRVPEDAAITGFDNLSCSKNNPVPITTIDQHFHSIGYHAAQLCYNSIGNEFKGFTHLSLPVTLIERESTKRTDK